MVLDTQPSADVTIGLSSSDTTEGTVSPASLTFTSANWNSAQTVTVTGVDDALEDGVIAYTIVTAAAVSTDTDYNALNPADVSVTNTDNDTASSTVEVRVSAGSDDAEEKLDSSSVNLTSSDMELVTDGQAQTVGLRFLSMTIPQGATITNAYVEFKTDEAKNGVTNLNFYGQAADNPATFTTANDNISSRVKTTAFAQWNNVPAWDTVGELHQTPDLSGVIQEIVDRAGWASGNAMVVLVTGSGTRTTEAYNGDPAGAALLHVEYSSP